MTPEQEKKVLAAIYDRLFDAITYQPAEGENPFTAKETFIHFAKNEAIDMASYANPVTPSNPPGNLKASEAFSLMVDQVSPMTLEWEKSGAKLSSTYESIIKSANANTKVDPKQKKMYDKAYGYLHQTIEKKDPFDDDAKPVKVTTDSPDYVAYEENMGDYVDAISDYRAQYNLYLDDLEDSDVKVSGKADRNWQATAPRFENEIKKAFRKLTAGNGEYVKQALDILQTTINDGIRRALAIAKAAVEQDHKYSSSLGTAGNPWLFSYPSPGNWAEDDGNLSFTHLAISGSNLKTRNDTSEHTFSVSTEVNWGLWKVKANASGEYKKENSSTDADSLSFSAEIAKVRINRPWFNESIFRLGSWYTNLGTKGSISNGKIDSSNAGGLIPMYPVAFVVARNIKIKADFSHEDIEKVSNATQAGGSVGWGPVSVSAQYGNKNTHEELNQDMQNGEINVPGMQIIGWVSRLTPQSPLMADPNTAAA